jgi:hypothetical protein
MPKIAKLISLTAAVCALIAAPAGAVDLRSPDAVDAAQQAQNQDLRSPDAVDSSNSVQRGLSVATYEATASPSSSGDDFEWGFVGAGIALALCIGGTIVMVRRHRRRRSPGQLVGVGS